MAALRAVVLRGQDVEKGGVTSWRPTIPAASSSNATRSATTRTRAALLARGDARHRPDVHPQITRQGVSTRAALKVMAEFGLDSLSSSQVSRAAALLDAEPEAWRASSLGAFTYLFLPLPVLGARYEKVRIEGQEAFDPIPARDRASRPWRRGSTMTASAACSESPSPSLSGVQSAAEVHWRGFLDSLVARGLRYRIRAACASSPATTTPASQISVWAARKAVFPGAIWQRCQFHLARNAIHHAPTAATRKAIGRQLRNVWNAADRASAGVPTRSRGLAAEAELARIVEGYAQSAPRGSNAPSPKAWPCSRFQKPTGGARLPPTPSSAPSSRNSNGAPERSASSPTRPPSNASQPPSSSKSTTNGSPPTEPTSP